MSLFGAILFFFIFTAVLGSAIAYSKARQKTRVYRQKRRKYETLAENLPQLKDRVLTEAGHWPIYARPVLFTDMDQRAQIEFAKAQQALSDADQILPEIETIGEPETPEPFQLNELINIPKNLRTISLGNQIVESVSAFEQVISSLKNSLKSLRANRHQVEKKRLSVEKSIGNLRKRTEQIQKRLKPLDMWQSIEAHNLSWLVDNANRCLFAAITSIENVTEDEHGYMEHVRADIFVTIGHFSLDCIDLFLESQKISRRYELDRFKELFSKSTSFLQDILEMDEVLSSWKKLKKIKPHIDALPGTRQRAEKSLRSFRNKQEHFEKLINLISRIDLDARTKFVNALEKECESYWYSYVERKTYWEKALGNPPRFPSTELHGFRTLLVTEINPNVDVDMVIKQSQILSLMKKMGDALSWHASIDALTHQLEAELNFHKEQQKLVNSLLEHHGRATQNFEEVSVVLLDTSPNFYDWGKVLVGDYNSYKERARNIQGADFPQLAISLNQFILESRKLVKDHYTQLRELESDYAALYEYIDSVNDEVQTYIGYIPKFEKDFIKMFGEAFKESSAILDQPKNQKYSWLRHAVNRMRVWSENIDTLIAPARNKYNAFEAGKARVDELLVQTQETIQRSTADIEQTWNWGMKEILPRITAKTQSFERKRREWDRLLKRNWTGYNITRAISECENLIQFCEGKIFELTQIVDKMHQKQLQLDDKAKDIEYLLGKNASKLSPQDRYQIESYVNIARETTNYDYVVKILNFAHSLAMRRATPQALQEVQKIIINSGGGPVFTAAVTNKGKIMGAQRFTLKPKGRKRNAKKR